MNVIVIGGGAAGMVAAIFAARNRRYSNHPRKDEKHGEKTFYYRKREM